MTAESIQPLWPDARDEALIARGRLEQLNGAGRRSADDELERAGLTERFEGDDAALSLYWELLDGEHDASARAAIGRILREQDDDLDLSWLD